MQIPTQGAKALKGTTWFLRKSRLGVTALMSVRGNIVLSVHLGAEVQTIAVHVPHLRIMGGAIVDIPRKTTTTIAVDIETGIGGDSLRLTVYYFCMRCQWTGSRSIGV